MLVKSVLQVVLVDVNAPMVRAWRSAFSDNPEVQIVHGSILDQQVDAWVTPTNARGRMDGGVDAVIRNHLGAGIEKRVQEEIRLLHGGSLPVGCATCVPTDVSVPCFLISTPTMVTSSEDISDTMNVALACAAAFQAVHMQNASGAGGITSVALPGLGASTGRVPVRTCANLMWTAYNLFTDYQFRNFGTMRAALEELLAAQGGLSGEAKVKIKLPDSNDWTV
jgi:O-acetyl-ADP-ribose deacetylase (regulator of RNase III)